MMNCSSCMSDCNQWLHSKHWCIVGHSTPHNQGVDSNLASLATCTSLLWIPDKSAFHPPLSCHLPPLFPSLSLTNPPVINVSHPLRSSQSHPQPLLCIIILPQGLGVFPSPWKTLMRGDMSVFPQPGEGWLVQCCATLVWWERMDPYVHHCGYCVWWI